ncbi:hypothetical protein HDV00_005306 [Rhizophlyctis rosea]|nr:hypothetical protein HDV00_005306 [Rhizophlyctis rosea]
MSAPTQVKETSQNLANSIISAFTAPSAFATLSLAPPFQAEVQQAVQSPSVVSGRKRTLDLVSNGDGSDSEHITEHEQNPLDVVQAAFASLASVGLADMSMGLVPPAGPAGKTTSYTHPWPPEEANKRQKKNTSRLASSDPTATAYSTPSTPATPPLETKWTRPPKPLKPLSVSRRRLLTSQIIGTMHGSLDSIFAAHRIALEKKGISFSKEDEKTVRKDVMEELVKRFRSEKLLLPEQSGCKDEADAGSSGKVSGEVETADTGTPTQDGEANDDRGGGGEASIAGPEGSRTGGEEAASQEGIPPTASKETPLMTYGETTVRNMLEWYQSEPAGDSPTKHKILSILQESFPIADVRALARRFGHPKLPWHICPHPPCFKTYTLTTFLRRHVRSVHTKERPFVCPHPGCGKTYITNDRMKSHAVMHSGEFPYSCEVETCGKKFKTRSSWRNHKVTHGEKNFACGIEGCGKRFFRSDNMKAHEKICEGAAEGGGRGKRRGGKTVAEEEEEDGGDDSESESESGSSSEKEEDRVEAGGVATATAITSSASVTYSTQPG